MKCPNSPTRDAVTGVVLAGGRGSRMGGVDKGLVLLHGRPLAAHVLERLRPQVAGVMLNVNRNRDQYRAFGLPLIGDADGGGQGPLAGMAAALAAAPTALVLTVPCDAPHLPADLAERLLARLDADTDLCVAADPERDQPVCALLRTRLLPSLEAFLAAGERKIDRWYARHRVGRVGFDDAAAFTNINRETDRLALEASGRAEDSVPQQHRNKPDT